MYYGNLTWEKALLLSHKTLLKTHPRSSKKLIPPHQWIKETVKKHLGGEYEYYAMGDNESKYDKEYKVPGSLYDKMVDVTIVKNNEVKGAISFKSVASNYNQNSNNYFENLVGECFNIQENNIPFCHVFVIRDKIPYYDTKRNVKKYEHFTQDNLTKYLKLDKIKSTGSPSKLSLSVIHIAGDMYNNNIIHPQKFKNLACEDQNKILNNISVEMSDYSEYSSNIAYELNKLNVHDVLKEFSQIIKNKT